MVRTRPLLSVESFLQRFDSFYRYIRNFVPNVNDAVW